MWQIHCVFVQNVFWLCGVGTPKEVWNICCGQRIISVDINCVLCMGNWALFHVDMGRSLGLWTIIYVRVICLLSFSLGHLVSKIFLMYVPPFPVILCLDCTIVLSIIRVFDFVNLQFNDDLVSSWDDNKAGDKGYSVLLCLTHMHTYERASPYGSHYNMY